MIVGLEVVCVGGGGSRRRKRRGRGVGCCGRLKQERFVALEASAVQRDLKNQ